MSNRSLPSSPLSASAQKGAFVASSSLPLSSRATALLSEIRESGSALVGRNDHVACGEIITSGISLGWVLPRNTRIADMANLREKGFDEIALA